MATVVVTVPEHAQKTGVASRVLTLLFSATAFWASALLFALEPMFAKMILPLFGGSPAVWNTSMVFFQSALFLAYIYSHYVTQRPFRQSLLAQSVAICVPLAVLPVNVSARVGLASIVNHPAAAVLILAAMSIGLPFFVVATTAPLLQKWLSQTHHATADDPYFLYAASNAGSLVGLALYPFVLEPLSHTSEQALMWSVGYRAFLVLMVACGSTAYYWRTSDPARTTDESDSALVAPERKDRLLWSALAFVPASLLYAVTAQLSIDFPPIPLLWVIPLGLYLLTFIFAFSTRSEMLRPAVRVLPSIIVAATFLFLFGFGVRIEGWVALGLVKLSCFVVIALSFHAELARRRPARKHLTEYYLWVSAGGIVGGLLNSFIAPAVFSNFWEYPLTLIFAAALLPAIAGVTRHPINKATSLFIALTVLFALAMRFVHSPSAPIIRFAILAFSAVLCIRVPVKWTAAVLLLVAVSIGWVNPFHPLYEGRSFFGKYLVTASEDGKWHFLMHGTTLHGLQQMGESPVTTIPQGYYWPVKTALDLTLSDRAEHNIAVVGLGAGIIGCYSDRGQATTFFEIDPLVERIARSYFTFLSECEGQKRVVLGDARLTLANASSHSFDVIVLDAFSSDAVPMHLLTREAFRLYTDKLKPDGVLLVHISNNYADLAPVVAGSGAQTGYRIMILSDTQLTQADAASGRRMSKWVAVLPLNLQPRFETVGWKVYAGPEVEWADDYSSIFGIMNWEKLLGTKLLARNHSATNRPQ